jgi:hypothetical protein
MLPSLIDDGCRQQLRGIELAHGESFEPSLLSAREALELRAPHVPELDVNPVGATLAEEDDRHGSSLGQGEQKAKLHDGLASLCCTGRTNWASPRSSRRFNEREISFGISPHAGRRAGVTLPRQWQRHALALAEQEWSRRVARDVNTIF